MRKLVVILFITFWGTSVYAQKFGTSSSASPNNSYIQSCKINGKAWSKFWFTHKDIENGGSIEFVIGAKPSNWGSQMVPPSMSDNQKITN